MVRLAASMCLGLALLACSSSTPTASVSPASSPAGSTPSASAAPTPTLSAGDRTQLAELEKRPLRIPAAAPDGSCNQGPFTPEIQPYANGVAEEEVYGAGPVYGQGGSPIQAAPYVYFDVTYFASPAGHGVVLVRINDVSGRYPGRFVGPLATGKSLGTDTIQGEKAAALSELALPADRPPSNNPAAAEGWGVWHIRQGIDARFTCAAIQIDTASTTEVILGH